MKELGVQSARYGIPWHKVNPERGRWDWSWADGPLEMLLDLGIDPIVDLVHYGTPSWMTAAFLNPDFPELMSDYAARLAERFKGRIRWYTPLNEPRITAWYSGKLGWWPPNRRGWRGFIAVTEAVCRGIALTVEALKSVDPEIVFAHVDATDLYSSADPELAGEALQRQEIVFLALDLVSGRVDKGHFLYDWLKRNGMTDASLDWFQQHAASLDVVGLNMYPLFTWKRLVRSSRGLRIRTPYGSATIVEDLGRLYWERYRRPIMITETASLGRKRERWLTESVDAVRRLRQEGVPVVGYTWWPMFSLVGWAYRQSDRPVSQYLLDLGLWNLDPNPQANLRRIPTELVMRYRDLVTHTEDAIGTLKHDAALIGAP
jgi:beta-glucosidase/6-phospho-beta-glucosidase/beta-galactosidase